MGYVCHRFHHCSQSMRTRNRGYVSTRRSWFRPERSSSLCRRRAGGCRRRSRRLRSSSRLCKSLSVTPLHKLHRLVLANLYMGMAALSDCYPLGFSNQASCGAPHSAPLPIFVEPGTAKKVDDWSHLLRASQWLFRSLWVSSSRPCPCFIQSMV